MKRIDERTVEYSERELAAVDAYNARLDEGHSVPHAAYLARQDHVGLSRAFWLNVVDYNPAWALGQVIAYWRSRSALTRKQLAEATRLSYPYVSEIENGRKDATLATYTRIGEAIDRSLVQLFDDAECLALGDATFPQPRLWERSV